MLRLLTSAGSRNHGWTTTKSTASSDHITAQLSASKGPTSTSREIAPPHDSCARHTQRAWRPVWLQRWFLASFTATCTALVAGLLLLFFLSKKDHGIGLLSTNHYTWTYAPTAVLIPIVAIWRQVDFHIKFLKPWDVLAKGDAEGHKTVLLDYVSPIQVTSLYAAIKRKHMHVVLSILGFSLLKLTALASTGLLLPVPTDVELVKPSLTKLASFNGTLTNTTLSPTLNETSLLYTAYGILAKGLSPRDGIHDGIVFEPFALEQTRAGLNATITAEVNALIPRFSCESAPVDIIPQPLNITDEHPLDIIQMTFPECTMPGNLKGRPAYVLNPQTFLCPPRQLSPVMQPIECLDGVDNWQLLTMTDFRYSQNVKSDSSEFLGDAVQASSWATLANRTTSIACRSTYSMHRVNVTYDLSSDIPTMSLGPPSQKEAKKLDGLTDADLGQLFTSSLSAASDMFGNVLEGAYAEEYPQTMSKFMAALADGRYESLLNETTMIGNAEKVFQAVAVEIIHKHFMQNASETLIGTIRSSEIRLHVNDISLWTMIAGLGFTVVVGIWLCLFQLHHSVPRNPEPVITMGLIVSQSRRAQTVFEANGVGDCFDSVEHYYFSTATPEHDDDKFELLVRGSLQVSPDLNCDGEASWWRPLFVQRCMYLIALSLPLACFAALEILQRISDSHQPNGFAVVSDTDSLATKFSTRYLPALIILLVATLINSVDFNIAVLAPYQGLRNGWTCANGPVSQAILGRTPPDALLTLLKHRNWGPLLSAIGALLASVLTVVVSGLYVIQADRASTIATIRTLDSFDATWKNSAVVDNGAAVLTSLSESANLTYAPFTYDELALPTMRLMENSTSLKIGVNSTLFINVPALRANLNCRQATTFNATRRSGPITGPSAFIEVSVALPPECQFGSPAGNSSTIDFTETFHFGFNNNASLIGKFLDLHVGPYNDTTMSSSGEIDPNSQQDNPPGCPSVALIYGYVDVNSEADTKVNVLSCYQELQSTPTRLGLTYPELHIHPSHPPLPDQGPITLMNASAGEVTASSFSFRPQLHFDRKLALFNQDEFDSSNSGSSPLDPFFQAVLFGKDHIPKEYLHSKSANEQATLKSAINGVYRRYMAQAVSANMRVRLPDVGDEEDRTENAEDRKILTATIVDPQGTLRVKQNKTSKIVLQVLLGVIFVCMALAVTITKMKEVLMHNPCCIAGVAALWAGSSFCKNEEGKVPMEAVGMGERQLGESGVLNGWEFRLGWREDKKGEGSRWGIESRWWERTRIRSHVRREHDSGL